MVVVKCAFVTSTLGLLPVENIKGEGKELKISYPVKERKTRMCRKVCQNYRVGDSQIFLPNLT